MNKSQSTLAVVSNYINVQHPELFINLLNNHKIKLSNKLMDFHHDQVAYGPFKGLKIEKKSHWSAPDRGAMILGIYEQEVLRELSSIPENYKIFIDLGAADGYYGVGVLINGVFEKSYCYEIAEAGRKSINENARLNEVESRVVVKGEAVKNFYMDIPTSERNKSVLFVDVEGAEFEIFDANTFKAFDQSIIFIEVHDFFHKNGTLLLNKLLADSKSTHNVKSIKMTSRDLSVFNELHDWCDHDRWLLCSEGRAKQMIWLKFDPII